MKLSSLLRSAVLLPLIVLLAGCASLLRQPAPTDQPPPAFDGFETIRYYPLSTDIGLPDLTDAYKIETPDQYQTEPDGTVVYNYLAL